MTTFGATRRARGGRAYALAAAVLVFVLILGGCGSGSDDGSGTTSSSGPPSTQSSSMQGGNTGGEDGGTVGGATTSATTRSSTSSATTGAAAAFSEHPADATTLAAIDDAYASFFSPGPNEESIDFLQHGAQLEKAVAGQGDSPRAGKTTATVSKATIIAPGVAKIVYSIIVGGQPLLPDQPGYAVKADEMWKVAEYTFCGLIRLKMGKNAPEECTSVAATEPPG